MAKTFEDTGCAGCLLTIQVCVPSLVYSGIVVNVNVKVAVLIAPWKTLEFD